LSKFKSKEMRKNNYFVLYDSKDNVLYFDNFEELSIHINYKLYDLVREFNRHKSNVITIFFDNKKMELATYVKKNKE